MPQFIIMSTFFVLPLYLHTVLGYDALQTGLTILPLSMALFVFALALVGAGNGLLVSRWATSSFSSFQKAVLADRALAAVAPQLSAQAEQNASFASVQQQMGSYK